MGDPGQEDKSQGDNRSGQLDESGLPGDSKAIWALKRMDDAKEKVFKWRSAAREADRFHAGKHYPREDMEKLQAEQRPNSMFNVAQKFIRYASGIERLSRQDLNYIARDLNNAEQRMAGSLVTKAYEWSMQNCDGDDELSRAFVDLLVRGMGWTDVQFDRTLDPAGMIKRIRVDGHEMWWDIDDQQKNNLMDARWVARERQIPVAVAVKRWPEHAEVIKAQAGQADTFGKPQFSYSLPNILVTGTASSFVLKCGWKTWNVSRDDLATGTLDLSVQ